MPSSFSYGKLNDKLVHIRDLKPETHRGLACNCVCPECGRRLQAHMGDMRSWHFQHQAEDLNCNPQPMTLLHAFVRDALAERRSLHIPARSYRIPMSVGAGSESIEFEVEDKMLNVVAAEAELREGSVQPDVIYTVEYQRRYAIEVRYTHAVDELKRQKLTHGYAGSLEFDVSDLPSSGITHLELEKYLAQAHRWEWLHGVELSYARNRAERSFRWKRSIWSVPHGFQSNPPAVTKATAKLKIVAKRMSWATSALRELKSRNLSHAEKANWLGALDKINRVAIACAGLRLDPEDLPAYLLQGRSDGVDFHGTLAHHPYSWQVVIFMRFGVGNESFHARDVAAWCLQAMPDRCKLEDRTLSANGFTRTAAYIHLFLLSLEFHRLLRPHPGSSLEEMRFIPMYKKVSDFKRFIDEKPPDQAVAAGSKIDAVMFARFRQAMHSPPPGDESP